MSKMPPNTPPSMPLNLVSTEQIQKVTCFCHIYHILCTIMCLFLLPLCILSAMKRKKGKVIFKLAFTFIRNFSCYLGEFCFVFCWIYLQVSFSLFFSSFFVQETAFKIINHKRKNHFVNVTSQGLKFILDSISLLSEMLLLF